VEIVIVSVILLLIGGGFLTTFLAGRSLYLGSDASIQVQQEARRALDNVVRELRESGTISCGSSAKTGASDCANVQQLNFQIARSYDATTSTVVWGNDTQDNGFVHYAVITPTGGTSAQLVRYQTAPATAGQVLTGACTAGNSGCRILANNVKAASSAFSWNPTARLVTSTIEVETSSQLTPGGTRTTSPLTVQIKLRNPDS
jgi:Tfp pilus assembly protein PilW